MMFCKSSVNYPNDLRYYKEEDKPAARRSTHLNVADEHGEEKQPTGDNKDAESHLQGVVGGCQGIAK